MAITQMLLRRCVTNWRAVHLAPSVIVHRTFCSNTGDSNSDSSPRPKRSVSNLLTKKRTPKQGHTQDVKQTESAKARTDQVDSRPKRDISQLLKKSGFGQKQVVSESETTGASESNVSQQTDGDIDPVLVSAAKKAVDELPGDKQRHLETLLSKMKTQRKAPPDGPVLRTERGEPERPRKQWPKVTARDDSAIEVREGDSAARTATERGEPERPRKQWPKVTARDDSAIEVREGDSAARTAREHGEMGRHVSWGNRRPPRIEQEVDSEHSGWNKSERPVGRRPTFQGKRLGPELGLKIFQPTMRTPSQGVRRWEWCSEHGTWHWFDDNIQKQLIQATANNENSCEITVHHRMYSAKSIEPLEPTDVVHELFKVEEQSEQVDSADDETKVKGNKKEERVVKEEELSDVFSTHGVDTDNMVVVHLETAATCKLRARRIENVYQYKDYGKWHDYDPDCQAHLKSVWERRQHVVQLSTDTAELTINLPHMRQVDDKTGYKRIVRFNTKGYFTWEWQDEHGNWNAYDDVTSNQLRKVQKRDRAILAKLTTSTYPDTCTVDLEEMQQTSTMVTHEIRCKDYACGAQTFDMLETRDWDRKVAQVPGNAFEEHIEWTKQGKMWKYPVDNEYGLEGEQSVAFHEHVFMQDYVEDFPDVPSIRHFMELVCVGLSQNAFMTVKQKHEHIEWYKDYFLEKLSEFEYELEGDAAEASQQIDSCVQ